MRVTVCRGRCNDAWSTTGRRLTRSWADWSGYGLGSWSTCPVRLTSQALSADVRTTHPNPSALRTGGRYRIQGELGRGGMAVVYLGRQLDLDRWVALKELALLVPGDTGLAARFLRE